MQTVWYDAFTGKHVRYGTALAHHLRSVGYKVFLTTRKHPDTVNLAELLGEKFRVIGEYDPSSLSTRLESGFNRMLQLVDIWRDKVPDVAVAHQSVDLSRVAFGLHVPFFLTADTGHAFAVNRLTLPLANVVVASEAIPMSLWKKYGIQKLVQFKGVDEAAWIKDFSPLCKFEFKKPLIVVRQVEMQASYYSGKDDVTLSLARKLSELGTVVFLSRYEKKGYEGLTVLEGFVDSASLAGQADLVVGAGGTISREAALQGVPSIVVSEFGRIHVNDYLGERGFPIYTVRASKVLDLAKRVVGKKRNVKDILAALENPINVLERLVAER